jgi:hypothetical protein
MAETAGLPLLETLCWFWLSYADVVLPMGVASCSFGGAGRPGICNESVGGKLCGFGADVCSDKLGGFGAVCNERDGGIGRGGCVTGREFGEGGMANPSRGTRAPVLREPGIGGRNRGASDGDDVSDPCPGTIGGGPGGGGGTGVCW